MSLQRLGYLCAAGVVLMLAPARAQAQLQPFRDRGTERWGYKRLDGSIVISARYIGAGAFHEGRAPIEDSLGFALVDTSGSIVERIPRDSVMASAEPVPPPSSMCAWSGPGRFPSVGLDCFLREVRAAGQAGGGEITRRPRGGELSSSALVPKLRYGVLVIEEIGYE